MSTVFTIIIIIGTIIFLFGVIKSLFKFAVIVAIILIALTAYGRYLGYFDCNLKSALNIITVEGGTLI